MCCKVCCQRSPCRDALCCAALCCPHQEGPGPGTCIMLRTGAVGASLCRSYVPARAAPVTGGRDDAGDARENKDSDSDLILFCLPNLWGCAWLKLFPPASAEALHFPSSSREYSAGTFWGRALRPTRVTWKRQVLGGDGLVQQGSKGTLQHRAPPLCVGGLQPGMSALVLVMQVRCVPWALHAARPEVHARWRRPRESGSSHRPTGA